MSADDDEPTAMSGSKPSLALLGATGYAGLEALRLLRAHPQFALTAVASRQRTGRNLAEEMPALAAGGLPQLVRADKLDWARYDAVLSALPHGSAAEILRAVPPQVRVVDMSADFRLKDAALYERTYGRPHAAPDLLPQAVYGLSEWNREEIAAARLVACPGCYPTASLLLLLPLVRAGLLEAEDIIIDAKSGVSGAGRAAAEERLFCEVGESAAPYALASHRHVPEMEAALRDATKASVGISFTPHLLPMNRGEIVTIYARLVPKQTLSAVREALDAAYAKSPFVHCLKSDALPSTRQVRGSNHCLLGAYADRLPQRVILIGVLDNLVKGAAGQAIQNLNLMFGFAEDAGLKGAPLFP